MFKVPFRMIYCDTIGSWIKETIWCFVVIKIWRNAVDLPPYLHAERSPDLCPWCAYPMPVGHEDPRRDLVKA